VAAVRRGIVIAVAVCLLAPAAALASGQAVITDCTDDGQLSNKYSQKDYASALADIPTDVDEYTDCRDVIKRAQTGGTGGGSGGSGGPGGTGSTPAGGDPLASATPAEKAALTAAQANGASKPVEIGGKLVQPGQLGFGGLGSPTTLPASLIAVLVALGIAAAAAGAMYVRNRVIARRAA